MLRKHLPVSVFLVLLLAFLCARASSPKRWSGWDFGDAQTMMASTVFRDDGFLATHFLWVPQPSSPIAKFMDDKEVRQHAHGTGGDQQFSGLGPKRMYTHWPSWYSIPYGVFAKLGLLDKTLFQCWASLLSITALVFFYLFLLNITSVTVATFTVVLYGLAPSFQCFADSMATMPYDDFFRFAFLWCWSERKEEDGALKRWALPGFIYLGGFLTSLDSFAFMPAVAVLSDFFRRKGEYRKTLTILGAFGATALLVQWLQNVAYLGWLGAWKDWNGYLGANGGLTFGERILQTLFIWLRAVNLTLFPCIFIAAVAYFFARRYFPRARPWLGALLFGGLAFPFIIPGKAPMAYEDRQLLPFAVLTFAICIVGFMKAIEDWFRKHEARPSFLHFALVSVFFLTVIVGNWHDFDPKYFKMMFDVPPVEHIEADQIVFFDRIRKEEKLPLVYFQIGRVINSKKYVKPGFSQINPVNEWYSHGTVLTVPDFQALAHDLGYFWRHAEGQFAPILLAKKMQDFPLPDDRFFEVQKFPWRIAQSWNVGDMWAFRLTPRPPSLAEAGPLR